MTDMLNGKLIVSPLRRVPGMKWWASITCNGIKVADVTGATEHECRAIADFFAHAANSRYREQSRDCLKHTFYSPNKG